MSDDFNCRILKSNITENIFGWNGIPEAIVVNALLATVKCFKICVNLHFFILILLLLQFLLVMLSTLRLIYFKRRARCNDWNIE